MRIGYVGLSTPLFYDYSRPAQRTKADTYSSPNPILDSPGALMLLYDELWFLTRSLCPQNLRAASFVRFLDETSLLGDIGDTDEAIQKLHQELSLRNRFERVSSLFQQYDHVRADVGITWGVGQDNHTHGLTVLGRDVSANSMSLQAFARDLLIHSQLPPNVDLVANRFGQYWLDDQVTAVREQELIRALTIRRIPSILTPRGPYHESIEYARQHHDLVAFRQWVVDTLAKASDAELTEVAEATENAMLAIQRELFLKTNSVASQVLSVGKTLASVAIDTVLPGVSTLADLMGQLRAARDARQIAWMGFLLSLEHRTALERTR